MEVYKHSIFLLKEIYQKIGEDFYASIEYAATSALCYRDIYYSIYE